MTIHTPAPNPGQKAAADAFFEFLFSDEPEFIISGAAGVGKTYLMSHIIDAIMPRYLEACKLVGIEPKYDEVVMTATTNKAAEVLAQGTKRPTSTIHSFLGLKVTEDFEKGISKLTKTRSWKIHDCKIIFIDECSMIDRQLWTAIREATANCKIVYVGDHNQLAPVQEVLSPIYCHDSPFFELTQPMRNANQPALMATCQQLRHTVQTGEFMPLRVSEGAIEHLNDEQMQQAIAAVFKEQTQTARILAYTNKRVIEYNDHIRGLRQLPASYQAGELLVNNTVMQTAKSLIPVEAGVEITHNHGLSRILIDEKENIYLDVEHLDFQADCGEHYSKIPYPVDRVHYQDLLKFYSRIKDWERYFYLKNQFIDLRPRDAATVHKSQGSTYDLVFIDLGNISTCHNPDQVARMLYVAFSRARSGVLLFGELADKYGGLIKA